MENMNGTEFLQTAGDFAFGQIREKIAEKLQDYIWMNELKATIKDRYRMHSADVNDPEAVKDWMLEELDNPHSSVWTYYEDLDHKEVVQAKERILETAVEKSCARNDVEVRAARNLIEHLMKLVENKLNESLTGNDQFLFNRLLLEMDDLFCQRLEEFIRKLIERLTHSPQPDESADLTGCLTDPPPSAGYVIGRDTELDEIRRILENQKTLMLVSGFGGIGKTTLAQRLFHTVRGSYDVTAWVPYSKNLRDSMVTAVRRNDSLKKSPDDWWSWFSNAIIQPGKGRKLFIIDNVDPTEDQSPDTDPYLADITGWPDATVLLTSRMESLNRYDPYPVGFMDDDRCVELFYCYYKKDAGHLQETAVRKLVTELAKNHTYTVELLARGAKTATSLNAYYEGLVRDGFTFPKLEVQTNHDGTASRTIARHLKVLFDRGNRSEPENAVLFDFAVLPNGSYLTEDELNDWFGVNINVVEKLVEDGWLQRKDDEYGKYAMHPLVREILRLRDGDLNPIPAGTAKAFIKYAENFGNEFIDAKHPFTELRRRLGFLLSVREETPDWTGEIDEANFYSRIGRAHELLGESTNALEFYQKALAIKEAKLGKDHTSTATTYNNIAGVYLDMGDTDRALEFYQKALAIKEAKLGKDHTSTATTYNNIAGVYQDMGDTDRALEFYQKALAIWEAKLGKDHPSTATTYNNIALVYSDMGDTDNALKFYQKDLAISEAQLGKDHPSTATTYNNIAGVYLDMGDTDNALKFYDKALAIKEAKLGKDHTSTATTYNNIAGVYRDMGDTDNALKFYQKDLAISEAKLGKDHPDTATTYNNIAGVYQDMGDTDNALKFYQKDLAISEAKLGKDHPDTATTYNNISTVYYSLRDWNNAIEFALRAYRIRLNRLGADHPKTKLSLRNLREDYLASGQSADEFESWLMSQLSRSAE